MKIVAFNWKDLDHPAAGGAEVYLHEIAERWVAAGHDVTVFCRAVPGRPAAAERNGVRLVRRGTATTVYREAARYWRKERPDADVILDCVNTRPFGTPRYAGGVPVVALVHQLAVEVWNEEMPPVIASIGRHFLEGRWLAPYREVPTVAVSDSTRADLERIGFRRVQVVPNGVSVPDTPEIPHTADRPTLLFVGRLVRTKRPGDAIAAHAIVRRRFADAELWFVGDGYLRRRLERPGPAGVRFFGRVSEAEKRDLMARAHVILAPGVREGWGRVVVEAGALGTPAVGYRIPGLRDSILDGETGLLVDASPHALAAGAVSLLADEAARERLGRNAKTWAARFDWDRSADRFLEILASAVRARPEPTKGSR